MQYALLIYETPADFDARSNDPQGEFWGAWRAYHRALVEGGVLVGGNALQPDSTATTLRLEGGHRRVQDGPYAETKERLGGFIILDLPSLKEALEWAARCPAAGTGAVEIRPVLTTPAEAP
jgi:hypothetical protein